MLRNYLKIAFRNISKFKLFSIINIAGLAVGLGVFLFFFRFYNWADTADSFHKDIDRIYNLVQVFDGGSEDDRYTAYIPYPSAPALKNDIPEIEEFTRFYDPGRPIVGFEDKKFFENQVLFADPNFLSFFTFNIIEGDRKRILSNLNSVAISESIAKKYFGDEQALNKIITLENKMDFVVTGVFQELDEYPSSSSLYGQFIIPLEAAQSLYGSVDDWKQNNTTTFIKIKDGSDVKRIGEKLKLSLNKYYQTSSESPKRLYLFPTKGIQFQAIHIQKFAGYSSFIAYTIFLTLGFLFLLIVIFNYVNLSTARYTERLREVGVRKVLGAKRSQLFKQFLGESLLLTLIAIPFALLTYNFIASTFSARIGLTFKLSLWTNTTVILAFILTTLFAGICAGIYPALLLSSFRPVQILKDKLLRGKSRGRMRKLLVIFQFSASVILIVMAMVWQKQTDFIYKVDLGYNRDGVVVVPLSGAAKTNLSLMQEKLNAYPEVEFATASIGIPGNWRTKNTVVPEGFIKNDAMMPYVYGIDYEFLESMKIQFTLGRSFSKSYQDDNKFIISQLFVDRMQWENPVGKTLKVGDNSGTIVGVVKDIYFDDPFFPLGPAVFYLESNNLNYLIIKTRTGNVQTVLDLAHNAWNEFAPGIPYEAFSLDEYFNLRNFSDTHLISEILSILGLIAISFSCLGILGLASYAVRGRVKEIGIRKVLGASLTTILTMLTKDFLKLIVIANFIALPIAYLASKSLLDYAFAVRTSIGVDIFILTIILTLLVALISITSQTYKAAQANPVESLKYE